jgi:ribosome modulation factor
MTHPHTKIFMTGVEAYRKNVRCDECPYWFEEFRQLWIDGWLFAASGSTRL